MSTGTVLSFKTQFLEKLVLETIQSKLSIKDSIQFIIKYLQKTGIPDFTISQSAYERLRRSVKEKIANNELDLNENSGDLLQNHTKIDYMINAYFFKLESELSKPESTQFEHGLEFKDWKIIDNISEMLIKLFSLKNKVNGHKHE